MSSLVIITAAPQATGSTVSSATDMAIQLETLIVGNGTVKGSENAKDINILILLMGLAVAVSFQDDNIRH